MVAFNTALKNHLVANGFNGDVNTAMAAQLRSLLAAEAADTTGGVNTLLFRWLGTQGQTGSMSSRLMGYLTSLGYTTGSLNDRWAASLNAQDFFSGSAPIVPVTTGMSLTETWTSRSTDYSGLASVASGSAAIECTIQASDTGLLMEAGGTGSGLIVYVHSGVLYAQFGVGTSAGPGANTAEVSWTITGSGSRLIEWSANGTNAVLYVDGVLIASDAFSNATIAGGNVGGLGNVRGDNVAANRAGIATTTGSGNYSGTLTEARIYAGQVTGDV